MGKTTKVKNRTRNDLGILIINSLFNKDWKGKGLNQPLTKKVSKLPINPRTKKSLKSTPLLASPHERGGTFYLPSLHREGLGRVGLIVLNIHTKAVCDYSASS
jgi:hypothetical protein